MTRVDYYIDSLLRSNSDWFLSAKFCGKIEDQNLTGTELPHEESAADDFSQE